MYEKLLIQAGAIFELMPVELLLYQNRRFSENKYQLAVDMPVRTCYP